MNSADLLARVESCSVRGMLAVLGARIDLEAPVRPGTPSGVRVRVTVRVPDSAGPGTVEIARTAVVVGDDVDAAVWAALVDALVHEAGECLLRDGRPVFDPHELPRSWPWDGPRRMG